MLRLFCLFVGLVATVHGACQDPFRQVGEGCYYFSLEDDLKKTWVEAREYCQDMGSGVDLAVLDYLCEDYVNMANYLLMADLVFISFTRMWVGATGFDDTFVWVDSRSLSVSSPHWYDSSPSLDSGCIELLSKTSTSGHVRIHLNDDPCTFSSYFICQTNINAQQ